MTLALKTTKTKKKYYKHHGDNKIVKDPERDRNPGKIIMILVHFANGAFANMKL